MTIVPHTGGALSIFHFGLVVPDLDEAVAKYSEGFNLSFAGVHDSTLDLLVDDEPKTVRLLATYSIDGPPYLELIEEGFGSTWAPGAFNMNHMGVWAKDHATAMANLEANGMPMRIRDAVVPHRFSYHQDATGVWIELVDADVQTTLDSWLATSYPEPFS